MLKQPVLNVLVLFYWSSKIGKIVARKIFKKKYRKALTERSKRYRPDKCYDLENVINFNKGLISVVIMGI